MRSISRAATSLGTCALITALLAPGCAHDDSSIFIQGVLAPPDPDTDTNKCTYTLDVTGPYISSGIMDVALSTTYSPMMLIGSQLISRASIEKGRTETARTVVEGGVVRIFDSAGTEIRAFTRLGSALLNPSTGTDPTYSSYSIILVDPSTADQARTQLAPSGLGSGQVKRLMVSVKVFGTTLGGTRVETNELQFPVTLCYGCLVNFPSDSVDRVLQQAEGGKPNCAASSEGATMRLACVPGVDQVVDCRQCQGNPACDPVNYL